MFGLPLETSIVVLGFPVFWIIYTLVFLWRSRHWDDELSDAEQDSSGGQS